MVDFDRLAPGTKVTVTDKHFYLSDGEQFADPDVEGGEEHVIISGPDTEGDYRVQADDEAFIGYVNKTCLVVDGQAYVEPGVVKLPTFESEEGHTFELVHDGNAVGFKVTHAVTGKVEYILLRPAENDLAPEPAPVVWLEMGEALDVTETIVHFTPTVT